MRNLIGLIIVVDAYLLVYYRLLLRYYTEQATGRKESNFGALFSLPPRKLIPEDKRHYFRRYWLAMLLMLACVAWLAANTRFNF